MRRFGNSNLIDAKHDGRFNKKNKYKKNRDESE